MTYLDMLNKHGVLASSVNLSQERKVDLVLQYAFAQRAEIAMTICSMCPHGDYYEFGSDGMATFRNFLTAFDIHGLSTQLPGTRFLAFDIFGDHKSGSPPSGNEDYFIAWSHHKGPNKLEQAKRTLSDHGLFVDRCLLTPGYFHDTLTPALTADLAGSGSRVGVAFLDCNLAESYLTCFDWIIDLLSGSRCFIYMDEYYVTEGVPQIYERFAANVHDRYHMKSHFVRNAGAFGALFLLMKEAPAHP